MIAKYKRLTDMYFRLRKRYKAMTAESVNSKIGKVMLLNIIELDRKMKEIEKNVPHNSINLWQIK